ncbi:MAG: hypothetical protein [Circoviridae sp.]|nr:MAG: hypothetical protein [Circoviridae sp.]
MTMPCAAVFAAVPNVVFCAPTRLTPRDLLSQLELLDGSYLHGCFYVPLKVWCATFFADFLAENVLTLELLKNCFQSFQSIFRVVVIGKYPSFTRNCSSRRTVSITVLRFQCFQLALHHIVWCSGIYTPENLKLKI